MCIRDRFFTYTEQVTIEKDKDYPLTATMKQQEMCIRDRYYHKYDAHKGTQWLALLSEWSS